jgi:hypothetical protein
LDKNSARTKEKTRAISYVPDKPENFVIHLYTAINLHSLMDSYMGILHQNVLRSPYIKILNISGGFVDGNPASAVWFCK